MARVKKIIYSVYIFLKQLSEKSDLTADFFKSAQVITVITRFRQFKKRFDSSFRQFTYYSKIIVIYSIFLVKICFN